MTVKEGTVCSLIQSFPVFLILAQNAQKCLKTPLVYKPPEPTHSPEYYEAIDALFQNLYGHGSSGGHGSPGVYGGSQGSHGIYAGGHSSPGHGYSFPDTSLSSCQYSYGKKYGNSKPCYQYVYTIGNGYNTYGSGLQGYMNYGRKGNIYALNNASTGSYAPNQVYNTKNKYQVVVKKTKIGKKRSRSKGFFPQRENQNRNVFGEAINQGRNVLQGLFNRPHRQRPVMTPTETIYIIETNDQKGQNPMVFRDQNNGNVNFQGNDPYRPNQGNDVYQPNQGNDGFRPNQGNDGFRPNQGNDGFQPNQGNDGYQPNQGGDRYQPNDGAVHFDNNQQNNQEDRGQNDNTPVPDNDPVNFEDSPKTQETTTLPPLTPVPVVNTESRNNFNFGTSSVFGETCETVEGGVGSCISLYECPQYLQILQESRAQATRILRQAHCGFEGNNPKVCCPRPGFPEVPQDTTTSSTTTTTTTTTAAPPQTSAPITKTAVEDFIAALPDPPECGVSNATFSRVVGGVNAKLGDFPWMALLGYKSRRGGTSWLCGGSLISPHHVLTAAHCIHNHETDLYVVRLGELDLAREDEGATPVDVLIKQQVKHEAYSPTSFTNDIGILILDRDVQYTNLIRPICMPKETELRAKNFEDFNPLIAGWGHTEFRGPAATHLQVLQLPVVSNEFCTQAYSAYKAQVIDQRVLCAGFKQGGKDACQGDSGGPLMQPIWSDQTYKTYFYQIGVVSYGKKCAEAGFPGVYTRTTHFIPWIEEKVLGHSAR